MGHCVRVIPTEGEWYLRAGELAECHGGSRVYLWSGDSRGSYYMQLPLHT